VEGDESITTCKDLKGVIYNAYGKSHSTATCTNILAASTAAGCCDFFCNICGEGETILPKKFETSISLWNYTTCGELHNVSYGLTATIDPQSCAAIDDVTRDACCVPTRTCGSMCGENNATLYPLNRIPVNAMGLYGNWSCEAIEEMSSRETCTVPDYLTICCSPSSTTTTPASPTTAEGDSTSAIPTTAPNKGDTPSAENDSAASVSTRSLIISMVASLVVSTAGTMMLWT